MPEKDGIKIKGHPDLHESDWFMGMKTNYLEGEEALLSGSLLILLVTGTYLMLINESYLGLGNFFGNAWSILIVLKHVLVLAFLALAVYSERAFLSKISDDKPEFLNKFRWVLNINTILGLTILLLTSIAQAG